MQDAGLQRAAGIFFDFSINPGSRLTVSGPLSYADADFAAIACQPKG